MRFYRHLYVSEGLEKKKDKLIHKMKKGKYPWTAYLLVLLEEGENQMEIFSTVLLKQKMMSDDIFVVGLADSESDAVQMVESLVREIYDNTGVVDIRTYIKQKELGEE